MNLCDREVFAQKDLIKRARKWAASKQGARDMRRALEESLQVAECLQKKRAVTEEQIHRPFTI